MILCTGIAIELPTVDGGPRGGTFVTKLIEAPGGSLAVNAKVRGEMRVEILDRDGRTLPGHEARECVPLRGDGVRQRVRWKGSADLGPLRGKPVKLRFLLRNASLYAFSFRGEA